jgi:hypothetical protein
MRCFDRYALRGGFHTHKVPFPHNCDIVQMIRFCCDSSQHAVMLNVQYISPIAIAGINMEVLVHSICCCNTGLCYDL